MWWSSRSHTIMYNYNDMYNYNPITKMNIQKEFLNFKFVIKSNRFCVSRTFYQIRNLKTLT